MPTSFTPLSLSVYRKESRRCPETGTQNSELKALRDWLLLEALEGKPSQAWGRMGANNTHPYVALLLMTVMCPVLATKHFCSSLLTAKSKKYSFPNRKGEIQLMCHFALHFPTLSSMSCGCDVEKCSSYLMGMRWLRPGAEKLFWILDGAACQTWWSTKDFCNAEKRKRILNSYLLPQPILCFNYIQ